jgi:hypothetical protein
MEITEGVIYLFEEIKMTFVVITFEDTWHSIHLRRRYMYVCIKNSTTILHQKVMQALNQETYYAIKLFFCISYGRGVMCSSLFQENVKSLLKLQVYQRDFGQMSHKNGKVNHCYNSKLYPSLLVGMIRNYSKTISSLS